MEVSIVLIQFSIGRRCTLYRRLRPHRLNDRPPNGPYRTLFIRTLIQRVAIYRLYPNLD